MLITKIYYEFNSKVLISVDGKICELVADALDQLLLSCHACQHLFNIASLSRLDFQAPALSRSRPEL